MELLKIFFFFLKVAWISFQEFQTDMEYLFCGKILRDKNFTFYHYCSTMIFLSDNNPIIYLQF